MLDECSQEQKQLHWSGRIFVVIKAHDGETNLFLALSEHW